MNILEQWDLEYLRNYFVIQISQLGNNEIWNTYTTTLSFKFPNLFFTLSHDA
jgi:hypothetical protein